MQSLIQILGTDSETAQERILELQSNGTKVTPFSFLSWLEGIKADSNMSQDLEPKRTRFFTDGWERYTGLGNVTDRNSFTPIMELYVKGHDLVYRYTISSDFGTDVEKL